MFKSLYSKIAAGLLILFFIVGLVFVWVTVFSTEMYQKEVNQKLNLHLAEQILKESILMEDGKVNHEALKNIFHMLMVINPGIEIYLLDMDGNILTYSAPKGSVKLKKVDLDPVREWVDKSKNAPLLGQDPKSLTRKKVFSAAVIEQDGKKQGYLYVILGGEQYDSVVDKIKSSYILQLSVWMMGAGLLFALIAGLLLFAMLTGRLKQLARVMDTFKPGDRISFPESRKKGSVSDEIDRLSETFQQMAERIENQMEELKASDQMRRELVANVSHDLRTPLATLQGYIETLLIKENQQTQEERRQYLETAIEHCRRLNRLVGDLLEIARLESPRIQIQKEAFNFAELVYDVIQKFSLKAREKNIDIIPKLQDELPFAMADIALIERVIENLIENAVSYTPLGGKIDIDILFDQKIHFFIQDTGPGIPSEEQKTIFERYYHVDKGPGSQKHHMGLGLAISKKIIELHGGTISVESSAETGTRFTFQLDSEMN